MQDGHLYAVAGRLGTGKTSFVSTVALHLALGGTPVLFVSLQQSAKKLAARLLHTEARVSNAWPDFEETFEISQSWLAATLSKLYENPLFITDTVNNSRDLLAQAETAAAKGMRLLIVDDIHSVPLGYDRHNELVTLNHSLKRFAVRRGMPVIVTLQASRAVMQRADKRPGLSDTHDAGFMEDISDVQMHLYQDEARGTAELSVVKNRCGYCETIPLNFYSVYTRFQDRDDKK